MPLVYLCFSLVDFPALVLPSLYSRVVCLSFVSGLNCRSLWSGTLYLRYFKWVIPIWHTCPVTWSNGVLLQRCCQLLPRSGSVLARQSNGFHALFIFSFEFDELQCSASTSGFSYVGLHDIDRRIHIRFIPTARLAPKLAFSWAQTRTRRGTA